MSFSKNSNFNFMKIIDLRSFSVIFFVFFVSTLSFGCQDNQRIVESNFEQGAEGWRLPDETMVVNNLSHSGTNSLYYANSSPGNYQVISRRLDVSPGEKIKVAVYLRGRDISNSRKPEEGASFYVQSYSATNEFLSGMFPRGLTGSFDWKELSGQFTVPENATSTTIGLYLRKGATGEVWFDDVVVETLKGSENQTTTAMSRVVAESKVYIDTEGYTVKDGKRIFPLGIYMSSASTTDDITLKKIASAGFNTILAYGYGTGPDPEAYLDRAKKNNLNVIYSFKDMYPKNKNGDMGYFLKASETIINKIKHHDALLAWYINDERGMIWIPHISQLYNLIKKNDPDHPAYQVSNREDLVMNFGDVGDVIGMDSYPIGIAKDLSQTARRMKAAVSTKNAANNTKSVWHAAQIMDWATYKNMKPAPPSVDEMRNLAYQAIALGAKGILFYSYFDLQKEKNRFGKIEKRYTEKRWDDVSKVIKEINGISQVILDGEEINIASLNKGELEVSAYRYRDEIYVFAANPFYENRTVTFDLPEGYSVIEAKQGRLVGVQRSGKVSLTLPSIGSGSFKLVKAH